MNKFKAVVFGGFVAGALLAAAPARAWEWPGWFDGGRDFRGDRWDFRRDRDRFDGRRDFRDFRGDRDFFRRDPGEFDRRRDFRDFRDDRDFFRRDRDEFGRDRRDFRRDFPRHFR